MHLQKHTLVGYTEVYFFNLYCSEKLNKELKHVGEQFYDMIFYSLEIIVEIRVDYV